MTTSTAAAIFMAASAKAPSVPRRCLGCDVASSRAVTAALSFPLPSAEELLSTSGPRRLRRTAASPPVAAATLSVPPTSALELALELALDLVFPDSPAPPVPSAQPVVAVAAAAAAADDDDDDDGDDDDDDGDGDGDDDDVAAEEHLPTSTDASLVELSLTLLDAPAPGAPDLLAELQSGEKKRF
jgi:hypothetical protein